MANLGDIGLAKGTQAVSPYIALFAFADRIHSLSDAARVQPLTGKTLFAGPNSRNKPSTPFVILIEDAVPSEAYLLSQRGVVADLPRRAASNGDLKFYDLDDGVYVASSTASASAYRITVTGTSYTIDVLSGGGGVAVADNMYGGVA